MMERLAQFDREHQTLIDYFAIIGPDAQQIQRVIEEICQDQSLEGDDYEDNEEALLRWTQSSHDNKSWRESKGSHRILIPTVLARFPKDDRVKYCFPLCLDDFFFERRERVYSQKDVEEIYDYWGGSADDSFESISLQDS